MAHLRGAGGFQLAGCPRLPHRNEEDRSGHRGRVAHSSVRFTQTITGPIRALFSFIATSTAKCAEPPFGIPGISQRSVRALETSSPPGSRSEISPRRSAYVAVESPIDALSYHSLFGVPQRFVGGRQLRRRDSASRADVPGIRPPPDFRRCSRQRPRGRARLAKGAG